MRILIVDDEPAMHDSYRRCFAPVAAGNDALSDMASELFGDAAMSAAASGDPIFDTVHCTQGLDAVAEVEEAIDELPQVRESAVIGIDHPDLGEGVVAVVAAHDESFADASNVKHALSNRLARFKQPREIIFVKELPRNAMGKIQKAVLREHYASLFDAHTS